MRGFRELASAPGPPWSWESLVHDITWAIEKDIKHSVDAN
jgi:hypothetical protein